MTKKSIKKTVKMTLPDYWGVNKKSNNKFTSNKKSLTTGTDWFGNNISKKPSKKKKNMNYQEAHTYFSLSPIGDADNDGVPNWRDCRPYDTNKQGKHIDAFKAKLSAIIPKASTTEPAQTTLDDFSEEDDGQAERALQRKQQRQELYQKAKTAAVGYVKRKGAEMEANYQQQMQKMQQHQQPQQQPQQAQRIQQFQGFQGNVGQEPQYERKIAPGMIRYKPVTKEQTTISRPLLRAPFQDQQRKGDFNPSRPTGTIPLVQFRTVRFHKLRFGRY